MPWVVLFEKRFFPEERRLLPKIIEARMLVKRRAKRFTTAKGIIDRRISMYVLEIVGRRGKCKESAQLRRTFDIEKGFFTRHLVK